MRNLLDLFDSFPARGDRPAVIQRTGVRRLCYSYGFLHGHALKMNAWLAGQGVGKGDRVVIWGPNGPWWGVAFWGCLARGAVVVPVDAVSGLERAGTIARLTEARVIVQGSREEGVPHLPTLPMGEMARILAGLAPMDRADGVAPDDMAEIIYRPLEETRL